jgi:hypothetical protein
LFDMVKDEWKRETEKKALTSAVDVDDIDDVALAAKLEPKVEVPADEGITAESQETPTSADDSPFKSDDELDDAALIAELESM